MLLSLSCNCYFNGNFLVQSFLCSCYVKNQLQNRISRSIYHSVKMKHVLVVIGKALIKDVFLRFAHFIFSSLNQMVRCPPLVFLIVFVTSFCITVCCTYPHVSITKDVYVSWFLDIIGSDTEVSIVQRYIHVIIFVLILGFNLRIILRYSSNSYKNFLDHPMFSSGKAYFVSSYLQFIPRNVDPYGVSADFLLVSFHAFLTFYCSSHTALIQIVSFAMYCIMIQKYFFGAHILSMVEMQ